MLEPIAYCDEKSLFLRLVVRSASFTRLVGCSLRLCGVMSSMMPEHSAAPGESFVPWFLGTKRKNHATLARGRRTTKVLVQVTLAAGDESAPFVLFGNASLRLMKGSSVFKPDTLEQITVLSTQCALYVYLLAGAVTVQ